MNEQRAVIFDWGGVLMRTEDHAPRHQWDQRLGLEPGSVERIVHGIDSWRDVQMGYLDLAAYWQAVAQKLRLTPDLLEALQDDFYRGDQLDERLVMLIRELRAENIPLGLLSNNTLALLDEIRQLGLADLFDACVISAQIGAMKPDPAAYHAILKALDIPPQNAAFVDDFPANVEGARAVGMHGILFQPDMDLADALRDWLHGNQHSA